MTNNSKSRQHAEEMFKRIQKPQGEPPDPSETQPEFDKQGTKTARLKELRLAKEATEKPRSEERSEEEDKSSQ